MNTDFLKFKIRCHSSLFVKKEKTNFFRKNGILTSDVLIDILIIILLFGLGLPIKSNPKPMVGLCRGNFSFIEEKFILYSI